MKIKKYTGISLESIFSKVKSDLGEKAVILSTKKITDNSMFGIPKIEVTAALTPPVFEESVLPKQTIDDETARKFLQAMREKIGKTATSKNDPIAREHNHQKSSGDPLNISSEIIEIKQLLKSFCLDSPHMDKRLEKMKSLLKSSHVDDDVILPLLEKCSRLIKSDKEKIISMSELENIVSEHLITEPFSLKAEPGDVILLLGTTGVGKTTTLAKLASLAKLNHDSPVSFLTLDSFRVGAHEHLAQYAKILDAPFKGVDKKENLAEIVENERKNHAVFIDSSGFSQYNKLRIRELNTVIKHIPQMKKLLLFSASTHPAEMKTILNNFCSIIDISGLIITKMDESEMPGQILSVSRNTKSPITFITNGQSVPDSILEAKSLNIARKILHGRIS